MIWSNIKNYVYGSAAILLLSLSIGFYISSNHYKNEAQLLTAQVSTLTDNLNRANSTITQMNENAEQTNKVSVKRQEDRKQSNISSTKKQEQLNEAIKTNPDWSDVPVPDGVLKSLQTE